MPEQISLIKIKKVVGVYYRNQQKTNRVVLYAKGGPSLGDDGNSVAWPIAKKYKFDLFVPDFIGHCRSDGEFNFKTNIETLHEAEAFLSGNLHATNTEKFQSIIANYKEIVLVGSSWGGSMIPFIDKYSPSQIKTLGMIKPVTDWPSQGRTKDKEEDVENTHRMINLAWSQVYRGYNQSEWPSIFSNQDAVEFNPINQVALLKGKRVLLVHGTEDDVVNYQKTLRYFKKLQKIGINVSLKLYKTDHGSKATKRGLNYILREVSKSN